MELKNIAVTDACAGTGPGEGCCWDSGCGVGGLGPNGEWFSEQVSEAICGWVKLRLAGAQLSGPLELLAVAVVMRLWGELITDAAQGIMGFPTASDNMSNAYNMPTMYMPKPPLSTAVRELSLAAVTLRCLPYAMRVPGSSNNVAGRLRRGFNGPLSLRGPFSLHNPEPN